MSYRPDIPLWQTHEQERRANIRARSVRFFEIVAVGCAVAASIGLAAVTLYGYFLL